MNTKLLTLGGALLMALALAGCSHECTRDADCATKGSNYACYLSTCQLKASPPVPDAGPTCSPSCGGSTPVCDTSGSAPACVQCDAADKSACTGSTPACDLASHTCVACASNSDCHDPSAPVCDTSVAGGACVACTGNNPGACAASGKVCDAAAHACVTCSSNADCKDPGAPVCDTSVSGGACVACDGQDSTHCGGATPYCNLTPNGVEQADTCVVCRTNADCGGLTCDTSVPGGVCRCTSSTECATATPNTPSCDLTTNVCVQCDSTVPCTDPTKPVCLLPADAGTATPGTCVQCTSDSNCSTQASAKSCDTQPSSPTQYSCVACVNGGSCGYDQDCAPQGDVSRTCQSVDVNGADSQIAAVRLAAGGDAGTVTLSTPLAMNNGLVTYVHPSIGGDPSGFFVQAKPTVVPAPNTSSAIFVLANSGTVNVGDRVQLQVTKLTTTSGLVKEVSGYTGLSVVNSGHSVAPLTADVSGVDLSVAANGASYESALLDVTGTLYADGGVTPASGAGFDQLILNDTGNSSNPAGQVFRFSTASQLETDLESGCTVTATHIPGWRFKTTAEPTAYSAADYTATNCPGPKIVSASDSDADTLQIYFDRTLDPTTVTPGVISFPFDDCSIQPQPAGCITVKSVSVSGRVITVQTSPQTRGQTYTVEVALSVKDKAGVALQPNGTRGGNPVADMSFTGNQYPPVLVINEVNPNLTTDGTAAGAVHDLVELKVLKGGYTGGLTLQINYKTYSAPNSSVDPVANFPGAYVATGDLILVHLNPNTTAGDAASSETNAKNENPASANAANSDNAWDFEGLTTPAYDTDLPMTTDEVLSIYSANTNTLLDAVPFAAATTGSGTGAANFASWLSAIETQGFWAPQTCASGCTNAVAEGSAVLWNTTSLTNAASGPSLQRIAGTTNQGHSASDWTIKASTWGADN